MSLKPFVSVVIPNLNNCQRLEQCLTALMEQDYPKDCYEVIVVDNGSTDGSFDLLGQYPVRAYQYLDSKSPYPCRNLGIRKAKGTLIALLDSNCIPVKSWIRGGVEAIAESKGDIIIGPLVWTFSDPPNVFEKFDFLLSDITKEDLPKKIALPGGNLFVPKILFQKLGYFSKDARSLGDIEWTGIAYKNGYRFGYTEMAKVHYPAKKHHAFAKKAIRLGKGRSILLKKDKSINPLKRLWILLKLFLPPSSQFMTWLQKRNDRLKLNFNVLQLFLLAWYYKVLRGVGMLMA